MHEPKQPGQLVFTTKGMSSQEGFERWRELFCRSTLPFSLERSGSGNFSAQARVQTMGKLVMLSSAYRQDFTTRGIRGRREVARTHEDGMVLFVNSNHHGSYFKYRKQEPFAVGGGEWVLTQPQDYSEGIIKRGAGEMHALTIPEEVCRAFRPLSGKALGRCMVSHHLPNALVANYIQTLSAGGVIPDAATGEALARNLMELVALAVSADPETMEACGNGLSSGLLLAISQYLDAHYLRPGLSASQAAAQLGITPRHVQRLLERAGTSFTEQLYQRRLRLAHRMLSDPLRNRSITVIAYDCGFSSLAHFGRRYREMYGRAPSETCNASR